MPSAIPARAASVPAYDHVFVIVMENHAYNQIIGSTAAPYVNSLLSSAGLAANYYAVSHPSLPNYLALAGGSTYGITSDCTTCWVSATNIADNLEASGSTWKAYMESMPSPCYVGDSYPYAQKHNPFVYFNDIRTNTTRCQAHDVPYSRLAGDLTSTSTTPNYAFITPNMCNDMHDCAIGTGDSWLQSNVPQILNSPAFKTQHSLLALTWDEDDSSGSNQVATILLGSNVGAALRSGVTYNHYSLLHTIEAARGLPALTSNDGGAATMTALFTGGVPNTLTPCTSSNLSASPVSPSTAGTRVTLTAASSGCPNPLYEYWMKPAGYTTWQMLQGYSTNAQFSWDSTGAAAGTETFGVWARDATSISLNDTYTNLAFAIGVDPCTSASLSATPSTAVAGAHISFTAAASGCTSPRYEFWLRPANSTSWFIAQPWSTSTSFSWNTTGASPGSLYAGVWIRDATSAAPNFDSFASVPLTITPAACGSVTIAASPSSPTSHLSAIRVAFTGVAANCSNASPLYEFWFFNGSSWQVVQGWSTASSYAWNTSGAPAGVWQFGVWVRDAASSSPAGRYDKYAGTSFTLT